MDANVFAHVLANAGVETRPGVPTECQYTGCTNQSIGHWCWECIECEWPHSIVDEEHFIGFKVVTQHYKGWLGSYGAYYPTIEPMILFAPGDLIFSPVGAMTEIISGNSKEAWKTSESDDGLLEKLRVIALLVRKADVWQTSQQFVRGAYACVVVGEFDPRAFPMSPTDADKTLKTAFPVIGEHRLSDIEIRAAIDRVEALEDSFRPKLSGEYVLPPALPEQIQDPEIRRKFFHLLFENVCEAEPLFADSSGFGSIRVREGKFPCSLRSRMVEGNLLPSRELLDTIRRVSTKLLYRLIPNGGTVVQV